MRKKLFCSLLCFIFLFIIFGCATVNTPEKRLAWMWSTYNSQYADYMLTTGYKYNVEQKQWVKTSSPELSEKRKEVLRNKKETMEEVYPLIKTYDFLVQNTILDGSESIDPDLEMKINSLLNQLLEY